MISQRFLSVPETFEFILKKYFLILKHLFIPFRLFESSIILNKQKFFYESKYGIAILQASLTKHYQELESLKQKKIKIILDIGANVGTFSLLCNKMFYPKKIYSFEPIPLIFNCLKHNCAYYKNIEVFNIALSEKNGISKMTFDSNNSIYSKFGNDKDTFNSIEIKTDSLKNFYTEKKLKKIDLIKIDVETFENLVLKGASDVLKNVRYLMLEVTIINNSNYTISSLFSMLIGEGYNFQLIYFRNPLEKSYGKVDWMDCLLENVLYKE